MRKIALLLSLAVIPLLASAQQTKIDELFEKYSGKEGFTTVLVNEEMFEVIKHMDEKSGEINGTFGKIKRVRVIAQEDEFEESEAVNFLDEVEGEDFTDYKELVVVKESDQEVLILAKQEGDRLAELLVLVAGEDNVLISIEGKFNMHDLASLDDMKIDGLDSLEKVF